VKTQDILSVSLPTFPLGPLPSPFDRLRVRAREAPQLLILSLSKDELVEGCLRTPRLGAEKLRLSLDKSFSFYVRSVSRGLNSLANLFFHYKSYPDFYTPPRQLSLSFDFAREGTACWIPFAAAISAA
jgi:hypothetical protein